MAPAANAPAIPNVAHARPLRTPAVAALVAIGLFALPAAVWLDLKNLSEQTLRAQVNELSTVIDAVRGYYAQNVVGRILSHRGETQVIHNYQQVPGAVPIPATLSIELGDAIGEKVGNVKYRFVSDFPFRNRAPHALDTFERGALEGLRKQPSTRFYEISGTLFDRKIRLAAPVIMGQACVACHNAHPESPKRDWKVGDVRAIQSITVDQPIEANIFAFKYLGLYFILAAVIGLGFIAYLRRQGQLIRGMNRELAANNDFLAAISMKIAKYLSPQVYKSIFSGQKEVAIATERKKLTIFFSDIKDFTATTERLQPEELTALLNEYLTEMSAIALAHGGTVDKFIGDAMLVFFGDPETKGVEEDARACMAMALDMQRRLLQLNAAWRRRGIENPFQVRMGINTGFCNVGNFGSADRMDYTIIGAEANLAARLQSIAESGGIMLSYETYALVRDMVRARAQAPITMKGISREVMPYAVETQMFESGARPPVINARVTGLDVFLDLEAMDEKAAERARGLLESALAAIAARGPGAGAAPAPQSS
ncbi:MAG TPA: adenylate/guanylate cyclase domain-containing protein [Alphaproteobacteria bacterium]